MPFRSWVREHAGQSVQAEWETWSSSGAARVLLVGFDSATEHLGSCFGGSLRNSSA